jgi:hypothetical protein
MAGLDPTDMEQAFRLHAEGLSGSGADGLTQVGQQLLLTT